MRGIGIYVHIPFCAAKCAYCDFLSFVADADTREHYVNSLLQEIEQWEDRGDFVPTVFFGGGTPSVLPPESIARILNKIREKFAVAPDAEISIECNPGTLDAEKLRIYRQAGINRLSMGLQSADNRELRLLGRIHTWEDFLQNFDLAREAGFDNLNVDLISALPGQTTQSWRATLQKVLKLCPEHLSAYSLMIEEGTPFFEKYGQEAAKKQKGEECRFLPSEEEELRMYHCTSKLLREHGYQRYEISNYALRGKECRHNCGYWERREYKGFGLGAASLMRERRFSNTRRMERYLRGEWDAAEPEVLGIKEQMEETMFLGLRMNRGVDLHAFRERYGIDALRVYGAVIARLQRQGLVYCRGDRLWLSEKGFDVGNYVFSEFLL